MKLVKLSAADIRKWNLSLNQLKAYLRNEEKKARELGQELQSATLELEQTAKQAGRVQGIKLPSFDFDTAEESALINAIVSLRAQNILTTAKIGQVKAQKKQLEKGTKKFGKTSGAAAHDKYARVMSGLSMAADVRETWSSDDVLEIDDVVMETGVSYDEAKGVVEQKRSSWRTGEAPPEDL